jgi:phage I-like protein
MAKPVAPSEAVIASAIEIGVSDGQVVRRVMLLPYGEYYGRDGRGPYVLQDKAQAEEVIAATRAFNKSQDFLFNYDHQSEYSAVQGVGGKAPAAGWIKLDTLEAGDDGIYGEVDWTPAAETALQAREYRYHSPHFRVSPQTRRVTRLVNAGLTNSPNLDLPALASQQSDEPTGEPMTMIALASLAAALSLPATAVEADVLTAIDGLKEKADAGEKVLASARTTLGLAADADGESVLAAVAQAKEAGDPDPTKFVPIDALKEVRAELATIREEKVLAMVDQAVAAGKLTPAQKDWATKLGKRDVGELMSFFGSAPVFEGAKPVAGEKVVTKHTQLTEVEVIACQMTGMTPEAFLKAKNEEIGVC